MHFEKENNFQDRQVLHNKHRQNTRKKDDSVSEENQCNSEFENYDTDSDIDIDLIKFIKPISDSTIQTNYSRLDTNTGFYLKLNIRNDFQDRQVLHNKHRQNTRKKR